MSRREIRHTRRDATRQRQQAEQQRRRQQDSDYWTTFPIDQEAAR